MKTKIVVDSSSNLYTLSGVDFACVPLKIVTDDGEYLDTAELDAVGMAQTLRSYKGKTGTSCPNEPYPFHIGIKRYHCTEYDDGK